MSMDKVLNQSVKDLLYGLFQSEPEIHGIGLYNTVGKLELSFHRTELAREALSYAIGAIIAKFGRQIIFHCHEEGDLGYFETTTHLVWFEPVSTNWILAYMLPLERGGKAMFLIENLKNTSQSLRYLLEKRKHVL